tara:strand:+ start:4570 stop:9018 length:4449 start_codon:yes stop_codon:yes gene_type:complete
MAIALKMSRKTLQALAALLAILSASAGIHASHIDADEAQHLLQWDKRQQFFESWLSAKKQDDKPLFQRLLEGHSEVTGNYRSSKTLADSYLTLDQLNHQWAQQAIDAYKTKDWLDAEHALSQLIQPVSPQLSSSTMLLEQIISMRLDQAVTSQNIKDPTLAALAEYNNVLLLIAQGQPAQALARLKQVQQTPAKKETPFDQRVRLLKAYLMTQTQQPEQARQLLQSFPSDHPLAGLKQQIEAQIHLSNGDSYNHLNLLLQSSQNSPQQISMTNTRLLEALHQQDAQTQAAIFASKWQEPLQQRYIALLTDLKQIKSQSFLDQLGQRQSGDRSSELESLMSKDSRLILTEIERINFLITQFRGQIPPMQQQQQLFNQGRNHLKTQLYKFKQFVPNIGARLPAAILGGDPAVFELESRLSELVGQPQPWEHRYVLIDGLAIWHTGVRFKNRWWEKAQNTSLAPVDLSAASEELATFAAEQISKTSLLEEIRIEQELPKLPKLEQRSRAILYQLDNQKQRLLTALAASLQFAPAELVLELEQNLLWLATQIAPRAHQFDQPEQQRWFNPRLSSPGPLPSKTQLPFKAALDALQTLADNALNSPVRHQAMRHLADLKLLISERILNGDPIEPIADVTPKEAISLYRQLLKLSDPEINRAQVLYQLAKSYEIDGQPEQSLAALQQLMLNSPDPLLLTEIQFRIAELQFGLRQYDLAAPTYQAVLTSDSSDEYRDKARYKLAWASFKQGDYAAALNDFFVLVDRHWPQQTDQSNAQSSTQSNTAPNQALLDDTLRVIALTFAYMDGARTLQQYFNQVGEKDYEAQIYSNLGAYFEYKYRYSDTAEVFNAMVERFPQSEDAPMLQSRVVAAYTEGGFPSKAWPARENFVSRFGIHSQAWLEADNAQRDKIRSFLAGYLVELAQRDHALAQQAKQQAGSDQQRQETSRKKFALALSWYEQFISAMPNNPRMAEMLFLKAEALTETDQIPESAITYKQVAYQYPDYVRSEEAGYAALLAYQALYLSSPKGSPNANRWLHRGIEEGLLYSKTFPDSVYQVKTQVKLAEDLLIQNEYQQAIEMANSLLEKKAKLDIPVLQRLWTVNAHAYFDTQEYPDAEFAYQQLLLLEPTTEERETLQRRLAESIYKQGEVAQAEGQTVAALEHFQRLEKAVPGAHILAQAKFDAATLLLQLERWPEAVVALEQFSTEHPADPLQATVHDKLVVAYEQTQNWPKAALTLERIFEREGDSALGRDALWRSATLQEKAGQSKLASIAYHRFIETFPSPHAPAMEARLKLYQLAKAGNDLKAQQQWLQAIVAAETQAIAANSSTDRSLFIASDAALTLGKQAMAEFNSQPLSLPLEKSLPRKQKSMQTTVRYLTQTSNFGLSAQSTEATALTGQLYLQFAQALMSSERPKQLDDLALEQYAILLEEQALPFEDQAIDLHEINVSRIAQEIYTPGIALSLDLLRQIMPARYAKDELVPEYTDAME